MAAHGAEAVTTPHKYQEAPARYIVAWPTSPPAADARGIVYQIGRDDGDMRVQGGVEHPVRRGLPLRKGAMAGP